LPTSDRPLFVIIAGPNGSGKSSVYQNGDFELSGRSVWIINPDLLAARIRDVEGVPLLDANIAAVQRIEAWLEASIEAHQTVGVETVLSTDKYRRLVTRAKKLGFEYRLVYVLLDSVRLNVERVQLRVRKGGHAVPENKIVERHARSLEQLPWFLDHADEASIFDNSGSKPKRIASKSGGTITIDASTLPEIREAVRRIESSSAN
jgi:predicted ABC-type ATPase